MTPVFLDTVGLLAVWDEDDQWHAKAEVAYQQIALQRRSVMTTTFILLECGNAASRRPYRNDVCALQRTLQRRGEIIVPTEGDWLVAWQCYESGEAGQAGIIDHISFAVMRRMGWTDAFANDRHFRAAGFTTLF